MAVSAAFRDHVADLFAPFGAVKIKQMFGGAGIYFKDRMFGLIANERIYLKADDSTRPAFDAERCKPFTFESKSGEVMSMSYFEIPDRLLDDADELAAWARSAYAVAVAAGGKKKPAPSAKTLPRDLPLVGPHKKPTSSKARRPRR